MISVNRFVDILNRIRQNANQAWLTPSQSVAYNLLQQRLKYLDEVNLWGYHGVGKTFLGWILHLQGFAIYSPCLELVQSLTFPQIIAVDNVGWNRSEVREAIHFCRSLGYKKVILITTESVEEQMAIIELRLTKDDLEKAANNLRSIGVIPFSDNPDNLWDLVSPLDLSG